MHTRAWHTHTRAHIDVRACARHCDDVGESQYFFFVSLYWHSAILSPKQQNLWLNAGHCFHHAKKGKQASRYYEKEFALDK